jgi:tetratricopeptide (TPR) repeat protein
MNAPKFNFQMFAYEILVIVVIGTAYHLLGLSQSWLLNIAAGWATVMFYRSIVSSTFTRAHTQGVRLVKKGRYADAITAFEKSAEYFGKHPGLDKARQFVLFNQSIYSFREMAYLNLGYIYLQTGDKKKAKESYQACLKEFPDNEAAKNALKKF